jgi:TonB family protein
MGSGKILIVDFDYENITRVSGWLEDAGYLILTARNGESGQELFSSESPDLAIIEPMLPKLHGFELSKEIAREIPGFPIILLSGFYQREQFRNEELESFGAAVFIKKPPEREFLLAHIRMLLESRAQPAPPPSRETAPPLNTAPPEPTGDFMDGEGRDAEPEASPRQEMKPADFEDALTLPMEEEPVAPPIEQTGSRELEDRLLEPLAPSVSKKGSGEGDEDRDDATAIDAMLADAFSDLVEPGLISKLPGGDRSEAIAPRPEPPASKPEEEIPKPPSPVDESRPVEKGDGDDPPSRMESDPFKSGESGAESENAAPIPAASEDNSPSYTFSSLEDTGRRRTPSRPMIAGAVILLSLFPAYYILKASRGARRPADAAPPPALTSETRLAETPELLKSDVPPEASPSESNSNSSPDAPRNEASNSVVGGNGTSVENPPPLDLEPIIPAEKPELGGPRTEDKPPPVSIEKELADPLLKEEGGPREKTPGNGSARGEEEAAVQRGDLLPISRVDTPPVLVRRTDPRYPASALGTRISGTVVINALISEAGDVLETAVLRGIKGPHDFNGEAERAVRKWKFTSPKKNGERVRVWKVISIAFKGVGSNHSG